MRSVRAILLLAALPLAACSSIQTYTDPGLTDETGILYYPPKPYLLVARTGAKDKPNDVQVIYLPDLSQPRYAKMKGGFGSSKLGLTFSNGVLVSANQESDLKIAETISALAGVPTSLATASKTRAEAANIREEAGDLSKAAAIAREVADDINAILADQRAATILNQSDRLKLQRVSASIVEAASMLDAPGSGSSEAAAALATLEGAKEALAAVKPPGDPSDTARDFWNRIRTAEAKLAVAIAELKPKKADLPTLTLYEILMTPVGTSLREVPLSTLATGGTGS
jgi:hypothetical protein